MLWTASAWLMVAALTLCIAGSGVIQHVGRGLEPSPQWAPTLWPTDVRHFLVEPNHTVTLRWNVSIRKKSQGVTKRAMFNYSIGTYTGCTPKCLKGGPNYSCLVRDSCAGWALPNAKVGPDGFEGGKGSASWETGGGPLSISLKLPTAGYYTITWSLPSGWNSSYGIIALPSFSSSARRDPVFGVVAFLSLGVAGPSWTPENGGFTQPESPAWGQPNAFGNYRPEFSQWMTQIISVLSRLGIASVREWGVGSDGGVFTPEGNLTFNSVAMQIRKELAAAHIGIVDLQLGPEAWMDVSWGGQQFARNLSAYSWKWKTQAELWTNAGGVKRDYIELYNELDIHSFAGSADQYMATVQAAAYGLAQGGDTTTKLLCGVVTDSVHSGWRQGMADNGLFSVCDALSFHSYDHSPLNWQGDDHSDLEIVGQWRGFLAANGNVGMPLMCTEAGTQQFTWNSVNTSMSPCWESGGNTSCGTDAWGVQLTCINGGCTGTYRPSDLRDRIFAYEVVNKAIMYKMYGLSRSFAFLLYYYNEAHGNFGLTGRDGTPVRALAAIGQAINVLANADYVGSLPWGNWQSAHVVRQPSGQLVAVIKIGRPGHQNTPPGQNSDPSQIFNSAGVGYRCNSKFPGCAVWSWYYPVQRLEGIDGRPLDTQHSACDVGGCSFTDDDDGIIYAFLAPSAVHAIQKHTLVGHLNSQRSREPVMPVRNKMAPQAYVMRWNLDHSHVEVLAGEQHPDGSTVGSQFAYAVSPGNASAFNFSVELHSLDSSSGVAEATPASLALTIDGGEEGDMMQVDVSVPRMGAVNASWKLDLASRADASGEVVLRVVASKIGQSTHIALPLVIRLIVGRWDCMSAGALNDKASGCDKGECNLC